MICFFVFCFTWAWTWVLPSRFLSLQSRKYASVDGVLGGFFCFVFFHLQLHKNSHHGTSARKGAMHDINPLLSMPICWTLEIIYCIYFDDEQKNCIVASIKEDVAETKLILFLHRLQADNISIFVQLFLVILQGVGIEIQILPSDTMESDGRNITVADVEAKRIKKKKKRLQQNSSSNVWKDSSKKFAVKAQMLSWVWTITHRASVCVHLLTDNMAFNLSGLNDTLLRCTVNVSPDPGFVLSILHDGEKPQTVATAPGSHNADLPYVSLSETVCLRGDGKYECQLHLNKHLITKRTFYYFPGNNLPPQPVKDSCRHICFALAKFWWWFFFLFFLFFNVIVQLKGPKYCKSHSSNVV